MSKYSEVVERILNDITIVKGDDHIVVDGFVYKKDFEVIKAAIYKAEKYDNENITYKKKFEAQLKYIAEVTEKAEKYDEIMKGNVVLKRIDELQEENQRLKEEIKKALEVLKND